jgi:YidC/Oxa1 family membrane protein insertase
LVEQQEKAQKGRQELPFEKRSKKKEKTSWIVNSDPIG